jgi:hypothetical protein
MDTFSKAVSAFFGAPLRAQTYLNMLYLFLAFPLGLAYFIFFVVGLSLGIGLLIIWVGALILAGVFAGWYGLLVFERAMVIGMLNESIPPMGESVSPGTGLWRRFSGMMRNPVTWKGLVYLLAKFPLGIVSFVVLVTFLTLGFSLLLAPAFYNVFPLVVDIADASVWRVDTMQEAVAASVAGVFVLLLSLQIFNGLAWVAGKFAKFMLGNFNRPTVPAAPAPVAVVATTAPADSPVVPPDAESVGQMPAAETELQAPAAETSAFRDQI